MPASNQSQNIDFGGPVSYRIVVQGHMPESFLRRFNGLTIKSIQDEGNVKRTILQGEFRDQAELRGVLETIYGLHLSVIAVEHCQND